MPQNFIKAFAAASALTLTLVHAALLPKTVSAIEVPDFSLLGAVGTLTEEQTAAVAETIYESLTSHSSFADFSRRNTAPITPTTDNLNSLMDIFVTVIGGWDVGILANKNDTNCLLSHSRSKGDYVAGMAIYYWPDKHEYDALYADAMAQLDAITANVDPSWSDVEKALYLHEYMAIHFDYDYDAIGRTPLTTEDKLRYTAYGMLKNGKAVCDGYAWLYGLLLRRVGIESMTVNSMALNHAWNALYLDGEWFYVDVTWDDAYQGNPGRVMHNSFLKDREAMAASRHFSNDWTLTTGKLASELADSAKYNDCFWNETTSAVQPYQDGWLAVVPDEDAVSQFNVYSFDALTGTASYETLTSAANRRGKERKLPDAAGCIVPSVHQNTIYYAAPDAVMAYTSGRHITLYELTEKQKVYGSIYGMYTEGDTLYYTLSESPLAAGKTFCLSLSGLPSLKPLPGDVNGDGAVSMPDVILLNRYLLGTGTLDNAQWERLDLVKDGCVDVFDLVMLKRFCLGIE